MTDFKAFDAILTNNMNTMILGTVIFSVLYAVFITCIALGLIRPCKTKKHKRDKIACIIVVTVFFGALSILFVANIIGYHLDIKHHSYESYYGEMEYDERDASKKRGAEYYLILDPDGESIRTTADQIDKEEGRYLGCAVYSKRTKILLYYEFFE